MTKRRGTYVVETSADNDSEGGNGADGTADGSRVVSLDAKISVGDTGSKESGVGGVDERSWGTVEFSKEDEEESKGGVLAEVAVGADGALKLGHVSGAVGFLVTRAVDLVRFTGAEVDVGVDTVDDDVSGEVRVVAGKEGRVR